MNPNSRSPLYADLSTGSSATLQPGSRDDDDSHHDDDTEMIPSDPARTTPEFLAALWQLIARGNQMVRGVSDVIVLE